MAYGKKYTITQILRDGLFQVVNIYEKSYTGSIKTYDATSITIEPNSDDEDPIGGIITSQLNVSFLISTQDDFEKFPDLLTYDDTKYYIELTISDQIKWKGYLFNDYINVPFTTGNQEVNLVCVDGLSLIRYNYYSTTINVNSTDSLINIIGTCLNKLGYNSDTHLYACCSYYANGMLNRGDGLRYEPFAQSYQFIRDISALDYYTILDNIITSFGCRLFQANGSWYILPMNQMASNIYYTKYLISNNPTYLSSGTLTNIINIEPYSEGNVHFIENTQNKIVRKGYPVVEATVSYKSALNYLFNGTFKSVTPGLGAGTADGWYAEAGGGGNATLIKDDSNQFNIYSIYHGPLSGYAQISNKFPVPYDVYKYTPQVYGPSAQLSFEWQAAGSGVTILVIISILISSTTYYLTSSETWTTTYSYITLTYDTYNLYIQKSQNIPLGSILSPSIIAEGYLSVAFRSEGSAGGGYIRNIKLNQSDPEVRSASIKRSIGTNNIVSKTIELSYGAIYPSVSSYSVLNNVNLLFNSSGSVLSNWYRYGHTLESYNSLPSLILRQYSNLLNKNIATLEGDLGSCDSANGMVYLDKVYTIQDSSSNALSYNNKKFMINRLTFNAYINQVNSIQLLEITDTDNASVETIEYIGDTTILRPKRYYSI